MGFNEQRDLVREIAEEQMAEADVFAEWCGDRPIKSIPLNDATGLLGSEIGTPLTINPTEEPGRAVRLLFDFGQMVVGFHAFTIEAPEGTILDLHNFEFIQPDGRQNLATV